MNNSGCRINQIGRLGIFLCLLFLYGSAAADNGMMLTVQVHGFKHQRGHAIANIFREGDDVLKPEKSYRRVKAEIHGDSAIIEFPDLA